MSLPPDEAPPDGWTRMEWVRDQGWREVAPVLDGLGFDNDGTLQARPLVVTAPGQIVTEAEFVVYPSDPLPRAGVTIALNQIALPSPDHCWETDEGFAGVELWLTDTERQRHLLHRDEAVGSSRGCPVRYTLAGVYIHDSDAQGDPTVVVMLNRFTFANHGPMRFAAAIAVELPAEAF